MPLYSYNICSDRCRTTNNLLGDCYGAAVVEALSKDDLRKMDEEKERKEREKAKEAEALGTARIVVDDRMMETGGGGAGDLKVVAVAAAPKAQAENSKADWSQATTKVRMPIGL